jgi:flagellin-like hook-associated protein FlgL
VRKTTILRTLVLALPLVLMNAGCILIPEIKERVVELAVGASTTVESHATGTTNVYDDTRTVDVKADVNLKDVLDENGVDVTDVKSIKLAGVSYRVTTAQAGRTISGGTVTIGRGSSAVVPTHTLVTSFNASAASTTGWITVPLSADGVTQVNTLLDDLLKDVKGTPASNTVVTYRIQGTSNPGNVDTDFVWEFKLELSIIGSVKVKVPD